MITSRSYYLALCTVINGVAKSSFDKISGLLHAVLTLSDAKRLTEHLKTKS